MFQARSAAAASYGSSSEMVGGSGGPAGAEARPEFDLDGFLDYGLEPLAPQVRSAAEASYGVPMGDVGIARSANPGDGGDVKGVADGRVVTLRPDVPNDMNVVLLHELAHIAQPSAGGEGVTRAGAAEEDADRAALGAMMGVRAAPTATRPGASAYATDEHVKVGDAAGGGSDAVDVNGVTFTMGQLNAIADYIANPDVLYSLETADLEKLRSYIERETAEPGSVTVGEWESIPGVDYIDLSLNNDEHFAPTDERIAPGAGGDDHASTWEGYYRSALTRARDAYEGGIDEAQYDRIWADVAFSEHYLTDAFAAGHLFNKTDAMALARSRIDAMEPDARDAMFFAVADTVLANERDIVHHYEIKVAGFWVWADRDFVFRRFVSGVYDERPDVVLNGIAMAAHDTLNAAGVMVENDLEPEAWLIQGDDHINPQTTEAIARALERHRALVEDVMAGSGDVESAIAEARGLFPRPTDESVAQIADTVQANTDPARDMQATLGAALTSKIASVLAGAAAAAPEKVRLHPGAEAPGDPVHDEPEEDVPPDEDAPADPPARTHTVQPGEWLSRIAEQHYGDMMKYEAIFDANKDRIPGFTDPDLIEPGWELVIPELPGG